MDTNSKGKLRKAIQHGENKSIPEYQSMKLTGGAL
jgi:hypothetical protein